MDRRKTVTDTQMLLRHTKHIDETGRDSCVDTDRSSLIRSNRSCEMQYGVHNGNVIFCIYEISLVA